MEKEIIKIPLIELNWSDWYPWIEIVTDGRKSGIQIPNFQSGVYEAKTIEDEKRLTIGKASNLRHRVRQGLVKGKTSHSSGDKIRDNEDISKIQVRWAKTDRPSAVEEDLHKKHFEKYNEFPKYVEHT